MPEGLFRLGDSIRERPSPLLPVAETRHPLRKETGRWSIRVMTLSDLSIRRPVLALVASLMIVVMGVAALLSIPVRELPDVDSAIVTVTTTYTGASPDIVDTDITEIVESAVAGISGVKTIASYSRRNRSRTVIVFEIGRNIDEAANDVRDAVGRIRSSLPEGTDEPRIVKNDSDADPVMRLAVTSERMAPAEITDYIDRFLIDRLATLQGVASIDIRGERRYAIRIWLDRRALAARNLTVADIETAMRRSNVELPAGEIVSRHRMLDVRLDSRLRNVEAFRNVVVDTVAGYPVRLGDVAKVELGVENDDLIVRANGVPAVGLAVLRQSQANTMEISEAVRAEIETIRPTLPDGMNIIVGSDDALFIAASIREVLIALSISMALVVLVIMLFLRSFRATLVPAITIPVSLIGCLSLVAAFGFSINVLTLLALLLAIGLVVDDAIVVLENIQRRTDLGESPLVASVLGTRQVTFAVISTSLTLIAVFVPISFLGGAVGRLFSEFGLVMAAAVVISSFVALSLCPVIASRVVKGHASKTRYPGEPGSTAQRRSRHRRAVARKPHLPRRAPGRTRRTAGHHRAFGRLRRRRCRALLRAPARAGAEGRSRCCFHPPDLAAGIDPLLYRRADTHRRARAPTAGCLGRYPHRLYHRRFVGPALPRLRRDAAGALGRARSIRLPDYGKGRAGAPFLARRTRFSDHSRRTRFARQLVPSARRCRRTQLRQRRNMGAGAARSCRSQ